jgi:hypothetical protein
MGCFALGARKLIRWQRMQLATVGESRAGGVLLVAQVLAVVKFASLCLHGSSLPGQDCS